jgi:hypothetical protein
MVLEDKHHNLRNMILILKKDFFKEDCYLDMGEPILIMEIFMKDNIKIIKSMGLEKYCMKVEVSMKEIF